MPLESREVFLKECLQNMYVLTLAMEDCALAYQITDVCRLTSLAFIDRIFRKMQENIFLSFISEKLSANKAHK